MAASAIWAANMRARRMMVAIRTVKSRLLKEYPTEFTGCTVRALLEVIFLQNLFIIVIKVGRNTPSQHLILAKFYAKGVPKSAIPAFSRYLILLESDFAPERTEVFCSSIDKMGNNDRK